MKIVNWALTLSTLVGVAQGLAAAPVELGWDDLLPSRPAAEVPPIVVPGKGPYGELKGFDDEFGGFDDEFGGFGDQFDGFGDSPFDQAFGFDDGAYDGPFSPAYASSYFTDVVPELNGKEVRLPGFIVPLDLDDVGNIRAFFLVPYFGACIHVPPPPPNQMVHVTVEEAFPLAAIWDPFWVEGTIRADQTATDLGVAGYTMRATKIEIYRE